MKRQILLLGLSVAAVGGLQAASTVVVNSAGGADFTTVQAAITSFAVGGSNAASAPPFTINVVPNGTGYDESMTLNSTAAGGNIVGDLTIKSSVAGTKALFKLRLGAGLSGTAPQDDGLQIGQNTANVSFKDILFIPSQTTPFADDLIAIDEPSANTTSNTVAFYSCIFTDCDATGNPVITTKAQCLTASPVQTGHFPLANNTLVMQQGTNGDFSNLILDDCALFGNYGGSAANNGFKTNRLANDGSNGEFIYINRTYIAASRELPLHYTAAANVGKVGNLTITGTDAGAGPSGATVIKKSSQNTVQLFIGTPAASVVNINNTILDTDTTGIQISVGGPLVSVSDSIINSSTNFNIGAATTDTKAVTFTRCTLHSNFKTLVSDAAAGLAGSVAFTDCIISGPGTKFTGTAPAGGVTVTNSGMPTAGPNAITAQSNMASGFSTSGIQTGDPNYVNTDLVNSASAFDVNGAPGYGTGGTGGAPLAGGADYIPGAGVRNWGFYE